jgi:hypothetical protein
MPRPKHNPTPEKRKLVKDLSAVGLPQEQIARKVGIRSSKTLRLHYREELDMGTIDANASVAGALYKKAMDGDTRAQTFWLENRAGWGRPAFTPSSLPPPPFVVVKEMAQSL